jgi:chromosome partitioning protein
VLHTANLCEFYCPRSHPNGINPEDVLGLKGGSGKSTLAIHLAVCSNRRVLLADTDPQATALAWAKARDLPEPIVKAVGPCDLAGTIKNTDNGCQLIIVDTAPRIEADVPALAKLASLIFAWMLPLTH